MAELYQNVEQLVENAKELFKNEYGSDPTHCGIGPGRVNLIGEHTDYNNGFVFPMALPLVTVAVGKMNDSGEVSICTKSDVGGESSKISGLKINELKRGTPA